MNKILLGAALVAAISLVACGGGGSSGSSGGGTIPNPGPSATPTVSPTNTPAVEQVKYAWAGTLAPNGSTGTFARSLTASPTPIPVQATLCDPRSADCRPPGQQQYTGTDINPTVDLTDNVSPAPSAAPTLSPPPGWGMALQHSSSPKFTYMANTPTQAGCGNMQVVFPNATGTVRECAYSVFTIGCVPSLSNQPGGGYSTSVSAGFAFDTQSYVTDPTKADVYMTGGTCPGLFYAANAGPDDYEIHFPYGAIGLDRGSNTLATVSPTQWANSMTQIEYNQNVVLPAPCGSQLGCLVLVKTASGNIAEMEISRGAADGPLDPVYGGDWFTAAFANASAGSFPQ